MALAAAVLLGLSAPAPAAPVAAAAAPAGSPEAEVLRATLDNGLRLVVVSDPLVRPVRRLGHDLAEYRGPERVHGTGVA